MDSLRDYEGTLVFVSHDRYFLDGLATKVLEIGNQTATLTWAITKTICTKNRSRRKRWRASSNLPGTPGSIAPEPAAEASPIAQKEEG